MRLVIEVTDEERSALLAFQRSFTPEATYSAVFRALFRMALDGTTPRDALQKALDSPRPSLHVTLTKDPGTDTTAVDYSIGPIERARQEAKALAAARQAEAIERIKAKQKGKRK